MYSVNSDMIVETLQRDCELILEDVTGNALPVTVTLIRVIGENEEEVELYGRVDVDYEEKIGNEYILTQKILVKITCPYVENVFEKGFEKNTTANLVDELYSSSKTRYYLNWLDLTPLTIVVKSNDNDTQVQEIMLEIEFLCDVYGDV